MGKDQAGAAAPSNRGKAQASACWRASRRRQAAPARAKRAEHICIVGDPPKATPPRQAALRKWPTSPICRSGAATCGRTGRLGRWADVSGSRRSFQPGRDQAPGVTRMALRERIGGHKPRQRGPACEGHRRVAEVAVPTERAHRSTGLGRHRFLLFFGRCVGPMTRRAHLGDNGRPRWPGIRNHQPCSPAAQRQQGQQDPQHRDSQPRPVHAADDRTYHSRAMGSWPATTSRRGEKGPCDGLGVAGPGLQPSGKAPVSLTPRRCAA